MLTTMTLLRLTSKSLSGSVLLGVIEEPPTHGIKLELDGKREVVEVD